MKYIFETEGADSIFTVKVYIEDTKFGIRSPQAYFELKKEENQTFEPIESVLLRLLDDVRLTVNERNYVQDNIKLFNKYLQSQSTETEEQIINE